AIEKVLFGEEEREKIRKQKLIIQGLVFASPGKESMTERYYKNKAFEALAIAEWEELSGIKENDAKSILYGWISGFTRPTLLSAGRPIKEKENFFGQT
ncbi:5074_t:CDS:2, partial [Gigaspora rosea]